jgi:hypothetical protein
MAITFHFRPEVKLVISVHTGTTQEDELIASYKSLYENDLFDISMNRLMDLRRADISQIGTGALIQLAELLRGQFTENAENPKVAVIAKRDLFFDLSRMYEVISDVVPLDIAVFHSAQVAMAWLGLPEDFMDDIDRNAQP